MSPIGIALGFAGQHQVLGLYDLIQLPKHQNDLDRKRFGNPPEQVEKYLDGLALVLGQPLASVLEFLHAFVFEIAPRVVLVGCPHSIHHQGKSSGLQGSHHHRSAGPGESAHHGQEICHRTLPSRISEVRKVRIKGSSQGIW